MIAPFHDAAQPEAAPPQAHPLGPQGGDEDKGEQACAGGEEGDGGRRRMSAGELSDVVRRGGGPADEARDGVWGGDLERGGAVVELVVQHLCVGAGDLEVAQGVGVQAVDAGRARCHLACTSEAKLAGFTLRSRGWARRRIRRTSPTVIDLADLDNLDWAAFGPPLGGPRIQQGIVLFGGTLDILPARDGEAVGDVGDQDLYVRTGEAGVKDEALDAEYQVSRVIAPPADVVEAEMQDEDVGLVGRDLRVHRLDVLPCRAAIDGEVRAAAAGGEERRHGGVVCAPGLRVGWVDVDRVY